MADFEVIRVVIALAMFASASYFDLKKRSVSDLLWVVFAAAGGIVYVFDFPTFEQGILIMISMAFTGAIAYGIYRFGLFGGADMLALITLSAILPLYDGTFLGIKALTFHPIAPFIVLTNAVIISVAQVVFNVLRNLAYNSRRPGKLFEGLEHEPTSYKILAMMMGHRSDNPQYAFPIERVVDGKREFDFSLKPAETADYETRKDVWVTAGLPFLLFFAAGFVMMIFGGDLLAFFFSLFY